MFGDDTDYDNDFSFKWMGIEPCNDVQADYILMKLTQQRKRCEVCKCCVGKQCDIFTTTEEVASLGKCLIEQRIRELNNNG